MRKFMRICLVAALAVALTGLPVVSTAQGFGTGFFVQQAKAKSVSDYLTAVSTDVGIYIKYVGTGAGASTVAVDAATGDVALVANGVVDVGSATGTIDTGDVCAGGVANSLDVSDAQCDTIGELVDMINASANWVAVPYGMLRSDSANNTLITLSATSAKGPAGLGLLKDTVVRLEMTNVLMQKDQWGASRGIADFMSGNKLIENPFADTDTTLIYASEDITTTDDAGNLITVYCVIPRFKEDGSSSESVQTLYVEAAGLTTAVGAVDEFRNSGGLTCNGGKLLVRTNGNTTLTAPLIFATGWAVAGNR